MGDLVTKIESPARDWADHAQLERSHLVSMRDGVRLSTDLYFPYGAERRELPCILIRTPYSKRNYRPGEMVTANFAKYHTIIVEFVRSGYVVAVQDVRGKFESEGNYFIYTGDADDGDDTLTWLGTRPWSNGRVGMYGCSYSGDVQIIAAQTRNEHLKCIVPQGASGGGRFPYIAFRLGGVIELAMYGGWLRMFGALRRYGAPAGITREDLLEIADYYRSEPEIPQISHAALKKLWRKLPIIDQMRAWGGPPTGWEELCARPLNSDAWSSQFDFVDDSKSIDTPCLMENSWYDFGVAETLNMHNRFRSIAANARSRNNQFAIISPTCHCESEFAGATTRVGDREIGDARFDFLSLHKRWFDHWLKHDRAEDFSAPPLQYFLMGANEWRQAQAWPLPQTRWTKFFLRSDGRANSRFGDGLLSQEAPCSEEASDAFFYDPATPTPTRGGPLCCTGAPDESEGALDQSEIEMRHDVLVYSTPRLEQAVDVVGPISLHLFVSSSSPDTDFTAKLVDVTPEGIAWNVQEGILRARYREGFDCERFMTPGEHYELTIDLQATGIRFGVGHRIRLEISSSNFPRFERNLNTGGRNYDEVEGQIARNIVHHDRDRPSFLMLPIIPQERED